MEHHFDFPLDYHLLEGDGQIVEGVHVVTSPGHTPGHQSVLIYLQGKPFIIAGDAIYTRENIERNIPPGNQWSLFYAMDSMAKLRNILDREKGRLVPGHEPDLWTMIKPFPHSYRTTHDSKTGKNE
jgi:N-acyl homoserine lactone hydrolase